MIGKMRGLWVQVLVAFIAALVLEFLFEVLLILVYPVSSAQAVPGVELFILQFVSLLLPLIPAAIFGLWISEKTTPFERVVIVSVVIGAVGLFVGLVGIMGSLLMSQSVLEYNYIEATFNMPYELTLEQFRFFALAEVVLQSAVNLFGHLGLGFAGGIASLLVKKK